MLSEQNFIKFRWISGGDFSGGDISGGDFSYRDVEFPAFSCPCVPLSVGFCVYVARLVTKNGTDKNNHGGEEKGHQNRNHFLKISNRQTHKK